MSLAEQFQALADEWRLHCQKVWFSSNMAQYLDHPARRQLVQLGRPAVPLIMDRYRSDDLPWGFVLQEITGVRMIDDPSSFQPAEVKKRWLQWWEAQEPQWLSPLPLSGEVIREAVK